MVCNKLKKFKINLQVNIIYGHPDLSKEGSRMKKQRGQMLVEFALLLPLFLLLLFGIMYCGFMYGDYLTLNNMARSAAREAVQSPHLVMIRNYWRMMRLKTAIVRLLKMLI